MAPKRRTVRDENVPAHANVLRGLTGPGPVTRAEFAEAARANHDRYGYWGVSVWMAVTDDDTDQLLRTPFARFDRVATYRVADLSAAGLAVLPTGAAPHADVVVITAGVPADGERALDLLLDRMLATAHTETDNVHVDREGDGS